MSRFADPLRRPSIPGLCSKSCAVASQRRLARDTYCLRLETPEIASRSFPGQFFMVRPVDGVNPLLGRPFALFDTCLEGEQPVGLEFGYVVVGKLTSLMPTWKAGGKASIWGPLGNGFPPPNADHLMLVAGGIGSDSVSGRRPRSARTACVRPSAAGRLAATAPGHALLWRALGRVPGRSRGF